MQFYSVMLSLFSISLLGCETASQTAASIRYPGPDANSLFAGGATLRVIEVEGAPLPGEARDKEMGEILTEIRRACGIVPYSPPDGQVTGSEEEQPAPPPRYASAVGSMAVDDLSNAWIQTLTTRVRPFFDPRAAVLPLSQGPRAVPRCFAAFRFGLAPRAAATETPALLWALAFQVATLPGGGDTMALAIRPVHGHVIRSAVEVSRGGGLYLRMTLAFDSIREDARTPLVREEFAFRATALGATLSSTSARAAPNSLRPAAVDPAVPAPAGPTLTVNPALGRPFPQAPAGLTLFSLAVLEAGDGAVAFASIAGAVPGHRQAVSDWLTGAPRPAPAAAGR